MITIPATNHFSPEECLWYLHRGNDEVLYQVKGNEVRRAFAFDGSKLLVNIRLVPGGITIEHLAGDDDPQLLERVKCFVNDWFDLGPDLQPFYDLLAMDNALTYMPAAFNGLRLIGIADLFEALCWAVTGQQINLTFAHKLKRRFVEAYGDYVLWQGERYFIFPDAAVIATLLSDDLRPMQFSASKANYLINIAKAFVDGSLDKGKLLQLPTFAERQAYLTAIKGIGTWTANYVLMKSLKDPSSIPYGDAGLNNALIRHGLMQNKTDLPGLNAIFQKFPGWEAYLVIYLWRSLAPMPSAGQ